MPDLATLDDAMMKPGRLVPAVNRLGGGTIAMTTANQPQRILGADAVVYQLRQTSGRVIALRCRLSDTVDPALAERYRRLATDESVKRLRAQPATPIVAGISYITDGITLPAEDFRSIAHPIVAMEWVSGPTLLAAAARASRSSDRGHLSALAAAWRKTVDALAATGFVHGDLTADNALLRPGEGIALVDYDTAYWPGAPKAEPAKGPVDYRHPSGRVAKSGNRRDDFAALLIYASLRILAQWPELRNDFGDEPTRQGGTLLFSAKDLQSPEASRLFGALRGIDDPEVRALIGMLVQACRLSVDDVPSFREAITAATQAVRRTPAARARPSIDPKERQHRLTRLNSLLLAGDDEEALRFWRSSGLEHDPEAVREIGPWIAEIERRRSDRPSTHPAGPRPSDTSHRPGRPQAERPARADAPAIEEERRHPATLDRLRLALERGDAAAVGAIWPEIRGDPAASAYAIQATAVLAKLLGAAIAGAIERGDDTAVVASVREAEEAGIAIGTTARRAVRMASARLATSQSLATALVRDDRPTLAALAISGRLDKLRSLEPGARRAAERAVAWPTLERALASDDDVAIVAAFDGDLFAGDGALTEDQRHRIDLARRRVAWLEKIRLSLRKRDSALLRSALADVPTGAERRLSRVERTRINRLTAHEQAIQRLEAALRDRSDTAIVDALNELESVGATLPDSLDWASVRGVVDRLSLAAAIRRAASSSPPDYARLGRLLPAARAAAGGEAPYLGPNLDFTTLEGDIRRAAHRARLRDAIAANDDKAIAAAAVPDPYGALATLSPTERARIDQAIAAGRAAPRDHPAPAPAPRPAGHD